jgi:hypothetical protein
MITNRRQFWAMALLMVSAVSYAQISSELSADLPDSRTMKIQDKVDALFMNGNYERAFFIYRNELVPLGDKYAQYMVGYMYKIGLGVEVDGVSAASWYQLAAERGTREFVAVRDRHLFFMDEDDVLRADEMYRDLRLRYSDLAVLLYSIERDLKSLKQRTGSRLGGQSSPLTIVSTGRSGPTYFETIRRRVKARVKLLKERGGIDGLVTDPDRINFRQLERAVLLRINSEQE